MTLASHFSSKIVVRLRIRVSGSSSGNHSAPIQTPCATGLNRRHRMETVGVDADSDSLSRGASPLPRFLKPIQPTHCSNTQVSVPVHAVYTHKHPFGDAHVLWWPAQPVTRRVCDSSNKTVPTPRTILLFIPGTFSFLHDDGRQRSTYKSKTKLLPPPPIRVCGCVCVLLIHLTLLPLGNPGLLEFYVPFLNAIYRSANPDPSSQTSSSSSPSSSTTSVTILAHSHLGLSSYTRLGNSDKSCSPWPEKSSVTLRAQIQAHLEFLDELLATYDDDPATRVLLVGHSIGCWLIQEMLRARAAGGLRSRVGAYMLFPTISHIVRSPNGRKLSVRISATPLLPFFRRYLLPTCVSHFNGGVQLFFRPPWPRTLAYLALLSRHVIPLSILRLLQPSWPTSQLRVVHNLLRAPAAIYAALTMANDEMETVHELDTDFLREFAQNLWFYYAEEDDWVGEQLGVVLRALRGTPAELHVVLGRPGIPHAFCISVSFFFLLSSHHDHCSYLCFPRRRSQRRGSFAMCRMDAQWWLSFWVISGSNPASYLLKVLFIHIQQLRRVFYSGQPFVGLCL